MALNLPPGADPIIAEAANALETSLTIQLKSLGQPHPSPKVKAALKVVGPLLGTLSIHNDAEREVAAAIARALALPREDR